MICDRLHALADLDEKAVTAMSDYYYLSYVLHPPSEDSGGMYMAEIPVLPGCRAWAATRDDTLEILTSVAQEFIASYKAHGEELPEGLRAEGLRTPVDLPELEDGRASERLLVAG